MKQQPQVHEAFKVRNEEEQRTMRDHLAADTCDRGVTRQPNAAKSSGPGRTLSGTLAVAIWFAPKFEDGHAIMDWAHSRRDKWINTDILGMQTGTTARCPSHLFSCALLAVQRMASCAAVQARWDVARGGV